MFVYSCSHIPAHNKSLHAKQCREHLPPNGNGQGLWGAGAGTDDLSSQPFGLKDVEESVAGGDGP